MLSFSFFSSFEQLQAQFVSSQAAAAQAHALATERCSQAESALATERAHRLQLHEQHERLTQAHATAVEAHQRAVVDHKTAVSTLTKTLQQTQAEQETTLAAAVQARQRAVLHFFSSFTHL